MQTWPPHLAGLPMLDARWYDSTTLGVYDAVQGMDIRPSSVSTKALWLVPFLQWAAGPVRYTEMGLDVDNAFMGSDFTYGIYANINGVPGRLLHAAPTFNAAVAGPATQAFLNPVLLAPGMYWLALLNDSRVEVAGWTGGSGIGASEGFSTLGTPDMASTASLNKQWGWFINNIDPAIIPGLPSNLSPLPAAGASPPGPLVLGIGFDIPRLGLLVG